MVAVLLQELKRQKKLMKIRDESFIFLHKPTLLQKKMLKAQVNQRKKGTGLAVTRITEVNTGAVSHQDVLVNFSE